MKEHMSRLFHPAEWPIATKLLVTFGVIALLPLLVVGGYGYSVAHETMVNAEVRALTTHSSDLASHLDMLLSERRRNIRQLAEDQEVRAFATAWPKASTGTQASAWRDVVNLAQANTYFQAVYLMNRQGEVILSSTDNVGLNFSFRPYFQEGLGGEEAVSDLSISVDTGLPVIYFSAPVRDSAGQVVAVAVLRVRAEEVWSLLETEEDQAVSSTTATLFDEYGLRLGHSSDRSLLFKAVVPLDPQVEAKLLAAHRLGTKQQIEATDLPELAAGIRQAEKQPHFTYHLTAAGETYHAGAAPLTTKPWTVVESAPESAFLAPAMRLRQTVGLVAGTIVLLALLVTLLTARWIVRPVQELTAAAQRLAAGDLHHSVADPQAPPRGEIGELIQSFETMRVSLQNSYAELESGNLRLKRLYELAVALTGSLTEVADRVVTIIAELLDVRVSFVEEILDDQIVVLSMYRDGQVHHGGTFPLAGTPCENVLMEKAVCHYNRAVTEFPRDPFLSRYGLTSYLGVPILDSHGGVLGIVNALDDHERDFTEEDIHLLQTLARRVGTEIEQAQAETELRRRARQLEAINQIITAATLVTDMATLLQTTLEHTLQAFHLPMGAIWVGRQHAILGLPPEAARIMTEAKPGKLVNLLDSVVTDDWQSVLPQAPKSQMVPMMTRMGVRASLAVPVLAGEEYVGGLSLASDQPHRWSAEEVSLAESVGREIGNAVSRLLRLEEVREHAEHMSSLAAVHEDLARPFTEEEVLRTIGQGALRLSRADRIAVYVREADDSVSCPWRQGLSSTYVEQAIANLQDLPGSQQLTGQEAVHIADVHEFSKDAPLREMAEEEGVRSILLWPLVYEGRTVAAVGCYYDLPHSCTAGELEVMQAFTRQAAQALVNARLFHAATRRAERLQALHTIDRAISASLDLEHTLQVILDQITTQLGVDAATILLLDPQTQALTHAGERGFRTSALHHTRLSLGEGHAGRAAREGRLVYVPDLPQNLDEFVRAPLLVDEDFVTYYGMPLMAKEHVVGVLEIFQRSPHAPEPEWTEFLESLAGQAAIAVENARLISDLRQVNLDLSMAYDATLEGWVRALDLRDNETENHTRRVTEMTLDMAQAFGLTTEQLLHIRRGALLHDIGKIAVPDRILLKEGKLTEEEWVIMRRHPVYAYELLYPVEYLRPALDIPAYHHEKWDGSGYPHGLEGEQIPLAARIFAVVDVWDALISDRPYRKAWPREKVLRYIQEESGKHFDPQVVKVFVEYVSGVYVSGE